MRTKTRSKVNVTLSILCPLVIGTVIALIIGLIIKDKDFDTIYMIDAIKTVTGIWGTILGFIISAESILIGFNGSERIREISKTRHYKLILYTYLITCVNLLISLGIFIPVIISKSFNLSLFIIFICALVVTLIDVALCIFYLWLMLMVSFKND